MTNETNKTKTSPKATGNRKQSRSKAVQKEQPSNESSKGVQQDEQQVVLMMPDLTEEYKASEKARKDKEGDISPYVSNVDGSVYAISGLPEEFIATLFAWVSRSSKSFKEHLRTALKDQDVGGSLDSFKQLDEKAKKFHEKWTVGYGHSSVAEHAVAHVGIESVSRLASAELELANPFLSITEYSQRYQKPERGKWHNPFSAILVGHPLNKPSMHELADEFYNKAFDAFETLIDGVYKHLKEDYHKSKKYKDLKKRQKDNDTDIEALTQIDKELKADYDALKKLAFEDARYVLPLAMHTQLGMTANGRAWRDALAVLGNSDHAESVKLADDLREEITKVLPVLLKYATPSQYQVNSKKRIKKWLDLKNDSRPPKNDVQLHSVKEESHAIDDIIGLLNLENGDMPFEIGQFLANRYTDKETKEKVIKDLIFEMQHFDMAPDVFKHVRYSATFAVSEANWHQLLRHNRMTDFTFGDATPHFGITLPPRIVEAGLTHIVKDIAQASQELYNKLVEEGFEHEAQYVVLNAHKRPIYASFSLWEAYHLINLRTSDEAQWDIRETFEELFKQLYTVHPLLISGAKRRL
jgi:thymidylate synthase ThyX